MAKPDNRKDNVKKLQEMLQNTEENFREAEDYLDEHADEISPEERARIQEKNARRERSIAGFRNEIRDEAHDRPE